MKQVYVAKSYAEAEMLGAELVGLGLDAVVQGDRAAIPTSPFPSIWVPEDQAEAAAQALADLGIGGTDSEE